MASLKSTGPNSSLRAMPPITMVPSAIPFSPWMPMSWFASASATPACAMNPSQPYFTVLGGAPPSRAPVFTPM